ncbi:MAG: ABC transporter permease [Anaerolineae bacterium]|nr:ABC transporter permease [Anaerolineae bacterium]
MINLLRAEWIKIVKYRVLMGFLIWLNPVGQGAFVTIAAIVALFSRESALPMAMTSSHQWTTDMMAPWAIITFFPINIIGRLLPLAFMAVVFAGEYEWDTWKNIIPRSQRVHLFLAKYAVLASLVTTSILATGLISALGFATNHKILGLDYGPEFNLETFSDFLGDYGQQLLLGLLSLLILAGVAALAAIITRSILGGLLASLGISVVEPMSLALLMFLRSIVNIPGIIKVYLMTPSFHLDNARSWFLEDLPLAATYVPDGTAISLGLSLTVLAVWAFGLTGLAAYLFQKQDIT